MNSANGWKWCDLYKNKPTCYVKNTGWSMLKLFTFSICVLELLRISLGEGSFPQLDGLNEGMASLFFMRNAGESKF